MARKLQKAGKISFLLMLSFSSVQTHLSFSAFGGFIHNVGLCNVAHADSRKNDVP